MKSESENTEKDNLKINTTIKRKPETHIKY